MSKNELALVKKDVVDVVSRKIREFQQRNEIHFPANYSPQNAMKSAWLILQVSKDKDKRPVLEVCTRDSIANALLDMVVQGLNPAKKQCYFIVYGNKLICQRSYFGSMHLVKEVAGAKDVYTQVVYRGDDFEYEIIKGRKKILKHIQKIENISNENIIAAYCVIEFEDERPDYTDIMTIDQIKKAWSKSKMNPEKEGSTHQQYTEEMAKKTVINRACKAYINSSNDSNLFLGAFNRADEERTEQEVAEGIAQNANSEVIDIEESMEEEQPEQAKEPAPKADQKTGTEAPGF